MVPSLFSLRGFVTFRQMKKNALFLKAYKQTVYLFGVRPRQYNTLKGSKKKCALHSIWGKRGEQNNFSLDFLRQTAEKTSDEQLHCTINVKAPRQSFMLIYPIMSETIREAASKLTSSVQGAKTVVVGKRLNVQLRKTVLKSVHI